nr:unnamed protein product [Spirometra erinaceieuropaei]
MSSPVKGFIAETALKQLESLIFQQHRPGFLVRKGRRSDLQPLLPTVQADENDFDDNANDEQDALLLLLSGVKKIITADMLKDYFSQFGRVLHLHMTIDHLTKEPRGAAYLKLRTKISARTILGMQHNVNGVRIIVKERSAPTGKQNASVRCPLCPVNTPVAGKAPRHSKQLNPPTNSPVTQACKELSPTVKVNGPCLKATNSVCTRPHQTENSARLNEFKVTARALLDELNKLRISVDTCNANGISNASVSRRFETSSSDDALKYVCETSDEQTFLYRNLSTFFHLNT